MNTTPYSEYGTMSAEHFIPPTPTDDAPAQQNHADGTLAPQKKAKPTKPYPDFPLFPHACGSWAKKIRGKLHYFGVWADPDAALSRYLEQKDALHAGRNPRPDNAAATVKDACNAFLNAKMDALDSGELSIRTWTEYKSICELLVQRLGKTHLLTDLGPMDFVALRKYMASRWGVSRLANAIQYARSVFKHAYDADLIDRPIRFGPTFKRPSRKTFRLHKASQGKKLFTAAEVRGLIDAASPQLRAMILLGINCGFGNADCGRLPIVTVDLDNAIIDYPRPKTGIARRCPLWPETVESLKDAMANRCEPKSKDDAGLVFVTTQGNAWVRDHGFSPIGDDTSKLLQRLHINGRRRLGFYSLRHTFRTVADESKDQPAVDFIMGHEVPHMSVVYRETISDARLRAVADHVRRWLFPSTSFVKSVAEV
jgi:integrase